MQIPIDYTPHAEEIFVWGVWGQKTIEKILGRLNDDISEINKALRGLYE